MQKNLGKGNHSYQSFWTLTGSALLSVYVWLLDPTKLYYNLISHSFSRPTPLFLLPLHPKGANLQRAKRPQPPLPSLPAVWVHTVAAASLPLCSQKHIAVCKPGAERPLASSHPADSPGTVPAPKVCMLVIKLRFYSTCPQNGTQEQSSAWCQTCP